MKKIKGFFCVVMIAAMFIVSAATSNTANATTKVKSEQIIIVTTNELLTGKKKFDRNQVVIEKCVGVVDDKYGYGHVVGFKDWVTYYGDLRYKGKKLKKGTMVKSYFPCDMYNDNETIDTGMARYDFVRVKNSKKKWVWKLINVRYM